MHLEKECWLTPDKIKDRFSIPNSHYFSIIHLLSFCHSKLSNLSKEETKMAFDDLTREGRKGFSFFNLYQSLKNHLLHLSPNTVFQKWQTILNDSGIIDMILADWNAVKGNIINESWRESYFKLMHNVIFGFNVALSL